MVHISNTYVVFSDCHEKGIFVNKVCLPYPNPILTQTQVYIDIKSYIPIPYPLSLSQYISLSLSQSLSKRHLKGSPFHFFVFSELHFPIISIQHTSAPAMYTQSCRRSVIDQMSAANKQYAYCAFLSPFLCTCLCVWNLA